MTLAGRFVQASFDPGRKAETSIRELKKHAIGSSVFVISRQTSSTDPRMKMRNTWVVSGTFRFLHFCTAFDSGLEIGHAACPEARVLGGPPVVDQADGDGVEEEVSDAPLSGRL